MIPWEDVVLCNEDHIPFSKKERKIKIKKDKKKSEKIRKNKKTDRTKKLLKKIAYCNDAIDQMHL